jgi:hypothetical protein
VRAASDSDESVQAAATSFIAGRPGVEATRTLVALLVTSRAQGPLLAALSTPVPGRIEGILDALGTADDELSPLLTAAAARAGAEGGRHDARREALAGGHRGGRARRADRSRSRGAARVRVRPRAVGLIPWA